MRLQGVADDAVFATDYRRVLVGQWQDDRVVFERVGRLPAPSRGPSSLGFHLKTTRGWKSTVERVTGRFPSVNLHPLGGDHLLATTGSYLLTSHDGGESWTERHRLPDASGPMGVLPTAVCVHDGLVYLGEYPLDNETVPKVLRSADDGRTWHTHLELPEIRHVHAIQPDPYTGDLWLTAGDTDEQSRIARVTDDGLDVVGTGSQRWRAVDVAFTPDAVLWGVDSAYAESNPILRLDRDEIGSADPTPKELVDAGNSVFYAESLTFDGEQWLAFTTACEVGTDSTAPDASVGDAGQARLLAASASTDFEEWHEIAAYDRRTSLSDRLAGLPAPSLPRAAAYVFVAAHDEGLLVNPWNTATEDGSLGIVRAERFRALS